MRFGRLAVCATAAASLTACDLVWDPGPPAAGAGPDYVFEMVPVRPAMAICGDLDAPFSLDHRVSVTVAGDRATIKATGKPTDRVGEALSMDVPQIVPGLYRSETARAGLRLVVSFDNQHQTKTLVISEVTNGCRWTGETRGPDKMGRSVGKWPRTTDWWRYDEEPFKPGTAYGVPR
jgi:hypothetical protein